MHIFTNALSLSLVFGSSLAIAPHFWVHAPICPENTDQTNVTLLRKVASFAFLTMTEALILAVGYNREWFSSGQVLRDTDTALGSSISVTSLHRLLGTLQDRHLIAQCGLKTDPVSGRAVTGYELTAKGRALLEHIAAAAETIAA